MTCSIRTLLILAVSWSRMFWWHLWLLTNFSTYSWHLWSLDLSVLSYAFLERRVRRLLFKDCRRSITENDFNIFWCMPVLVLFGLERKYFLDMTHESSMPLPANSQCPLGDIMRPWPRTLNFSLSADVLFAKSRHWPRICCMENTCCRKWVSFLYTFSIIVQPFPSRIHLLFLQRSFCLKEK